MNAAEITRRGALGLLFGGAATAAQAAGAIRLRLRGSGAMPEADYLVDPTQPASGNRYQYIADLPATAGKVVALRRDGVIHRPAAALPTVLDDYNIAHSPGAGATFIGYGAGDSVIVSGAPLFTGAESSETVNGVPCRVLDQGHAINPFWFPQVDGAASFPSICAPTLDDEVDSFISDPYAVDTVAPGLRGYLFPGAANWGGTSDTAKKVSYVDRGAGAPGLRYWTTLRFPGFWARVNAAQAIEAGQPMVARTGANLTDFFCEVVSYDPVDGSVVMGSRYAPYAGGDSSLFFFALVAHRYGLRKAKQYALTPGREGWIVALPAGVTAVASYSTIFYNTQDGVVFHPSVTWRPEAIAHGNDATRGGCFVKLDQGVNGFTIGDVIARQLRNYDRQGGPVNGNGAGGLSNVTIGRITVLESIGVKHMEVANGGSPTSVHVPYVGVAVECGPGVRIGSHGNGISLGNWIGAPRALIHDNPATVYGDARDTHIYNGLASDQVNGVATQWNAGANPYVAANRRVTNVMINGRPNIAGTDWEMTAGFRNDGGGAGAVWDRAIGVSCKYNLINGQQGAYPNTGMEIRRGIFDYLYCGDANALPSGLVRWVYFHGKKAGNIAQATVQAHLEANGATVENCFEAAGVFNGYLVADAVKCLTRNDADTGYEDVQWLAEELGLVVRAFGSIRTIVAPVFNHQPFRPGHQAGVVYGSFINPNQDAVMTLPAGVEDNGLLQAALYAGYKAIPAVDCPDQPYFRIALDVNDPGAENGPTQRFFYEITIGASDRAYTFGTQ